MSTQKAISGNPQRNNGGTVVKAGNITSNGPITSQRTLMNNAMEDGYGSKVILAVSPTSSGTLGTFNGKTIFANPVANGVYHGVKLTSVINGSTDGAYAISAGAADAGNRRYPTPITSTRRLDETSWDYVTGDVTKGGNAGAVSSFGADHAATPTNAIPGELTYKTGALIPVNDDYKPRTNP